MKRYINFLYCLCVFLSTASLIAQDEDNDAGEYDYQTELSRIANKDHILSEMPIGYASDFPLYSNDVVYIQFGRYPRMIPGKKYDPYEPDMKKRRNFEMKKAVVFSHIIVLKQDEEINKASKKVREWFKINAKNAGYEEVESVESDFGEYFSMKYVKKDDASIKTVDVEIKRGRVFILAFADEEVEPVPIPVFEGKVPVPSNSPN